MKDHYLKESSICEIDADPMDSYVWKNIIAARQLASLHMYENPMELSLYLLLGTL